MSVSIWWLALAFIGGLSGGIFITTCCFHFKQLGAQQGHY